MPRGVQAHDELTIIRNEYTQKAMISLVSVILNAYIVRYIKAIELKKEESHEERDFVVSIF